MMTAYSGGRVNEFKNNPAVHYLMYNAIMDSRTTKLCKTLHGTIKPKDDRFWDKFFPPNHYNCRSTVYPVYKSELGEEHAYTEQDEKTGKIVVKKIKKEPSKITEKELYDDPQILLEHQFRGNPEKAIYEIPDSLIDRAIKYGILEDLIKTARNYFCKIKLSTEDECEEELKRIFGFSKPKIDEYQSWIKRVLKSGYKAKGEIKNIRWIERFIRQKVKELMRYDLDENPIITISDKAVLHLLRTAKKKRGATIPEEFIYTLPIILENPQAILLDTQDKSELPVLLYIYPVKDRKAKFVIKMKRTVKVVIDKKREKLEVNLLTTAGMVKIEDLKQRRYILLKGSL